MRQKSTNFRSWKLDSAELRALNPKPNARKAEHQHNSHHHIGRNIRDSLVKAGGRRRCKRKWLKSCLSSSQILRFLSPFHATGNLPQHTSRNLEVCNPEKIRIVPRLGDTGPLEGRTTSPKKACGVITSTLTRESRDIQPFFPFLPHSTGRRILAFQMRDWKVLL